MQKNLELERIKVENNANVLYRNRSQKMHLYNCPRNYSEIHTIRHKKRSHDKSKNRHYGHTNFDHTCKITTQFLGPAKNLNFSHYSGFKLLKQLIFEELEMIKTMRFLNRFVKKTSRKPGLNF